MTYHPYHWLPPRARAAVGIVMGPLFALLCTYGAIRMAFQREWGYSVTSAVMTLIFVWVGGDSYRLLSRRPAERRADDSGPIN